MGKAAQKILNNVRATYAVVHGSGVSELTVHLPDDIDVKAIRRQLQLSQAVFAARFAVDLRTVQNWEQGQRRPEGPAGVLLQVIDREPEAVMRALQAVA